MTRSMPNDPQMLDLILQSRNMELVSTTVTFPVSSVSGFMAETYITSVSTVARGYLGHEYTGGTLCDDWGRDGWDAGW